MKKQEKQNNSKLKIIPLGGLEQIGMNILPLNTKTVLLWWIAVSHSRKMTCTEWIWLFRMSLI